MSEQTIEAAASAFQYGQAAEYTSDAMAVVSLAGRALYHNRAFVDLLGYTTQQLNMGGNFFALFIDPKIVGAILSDLAQGRVWSDEVELRKRSGAGLWFLMRAHPLKDHNGQVVALVAALTDISDRKAAERQLRYKTLLKQAVNHIIQAVRSSLEPNTIFITAVQEIAQFLKVDRAGIFRYQPELKCWTNVADCFLRPGLSSNFGLQIPDENNPLAARLKALEVIRIDSSDSVTDPVNREFAAQYPGAWLMVPLHFQEQIWGSLTLSMADIPRLWLDDEVELVTDVASQISIAIQQAQLYEQVKEQAEQEQLLNAIVQDIRNSLDLDQVLKNAASTLRIVFKADRCAVSLCTDTDRDFRLTAVSSQPGVPDITGERIPIVGNPLVELNWVQEDPVVVNDTANSDLFAPLYLLAVRLKTRSIMVATIRAGGIIAGMLSVQQCHAPRTWTPKESRLLKKVADQLAVAIQHGQMFLKTQQQATQLTLINQELEHEVQTRTEQLHHALNLEIVLNRIADKIRNSLDEAQILQTAVVELGEALAVPSCHAALYNETKTTATIHYEYREEGFPSRLHQKIQLKDYPELYSSLLTQVPTHFHEPEGHAHWLLCTIGDDQAFVGHLGVLLTDKSRTWPYMGIRLAQQVANHCFIALRQARLYQASLAHVTELERLSQLKDDFLSTVSHELRAPVSNMRMAITLLKEDSVPKKNNHSPKEPSHLERSKRYLEVLEHECLREIRLINDLLNFHKLEKNQASLNLKTLQLQTWIPELIKSFEDRIREQQQQFTLEIPDDFPSVTTESMSLERIVTELLNNAVKYTPANENILLRIQAKQAHWHLELKNTGVQLAADELKKIFEKFYRIPSMDRWQQPGTGLGLALVKNLVIRLGGEVSAHSPAKFLLFCLKFPYSIGT